MAHADRQFFPPVFNKRVGQHLAVSKIVGIDGVNILKVAFDFTDYDHRHTVGIEPREKGFIGGRTQHNDPFDHFLLYFAFAF